MQARVIIIGAGPGGAAAAIRLGQRGVKDVLLLDRDGFPRDKTCGSALSPNAMKLTLELGIGADVRRLGYPIRTLRLKTPGNREIEVSSDESAVVLLRRHFDSLLVDRAEALGVRLQTGARATELIQESGRVVGVRTTDGDLRADYILCADGAHSIFSRDDRPRRSISTLMGWWTDFDFKPGTIEMIFDRALSPLYGWMFPEADDRVNIGICMDGELPDGTKQPRSVRTVFERFLDDHYRDRIRTARQVGRWKGHPIAYTTWIDRCTAPGALYLGESARITHNATGEGIYQAMQSGVFASDAIADVTSAKVSERESWRRYVWQCRRRFTAGFLGGHLLRGVLQTPLLDAVSIGYNDPRVRRLANWTLGSMLAGSEIRGGAA